MQLKEKLATQIEPMRETVKSLIKNHGDKVISEVTIRQALGGIRGVKCLVCDTSNLDPMEGIRFRGYTSSRGHFSFIDDRGIAYRK